MMRKARNAILFGIVLFFGTAAFSQMFEVYGEYSYLSRRACGPRKCMKNQTRRARLFNGLVWFFEPAVQPDLVGP
jgi:hypothetical protein